MPRFSAFLLQPLLCKDKQRELEGGLGPINSARFDRTSFDFAAPRYEIHIMGEDENRSSSYLISECVWSISEA